MRNRRIYVAAVVAAVATWSPAVAWAVETYDGTAFQALARQSVDVMALHQIVAQSELNLDRTLPHLSLTFRSAPANFVTGDGTKSSGGLARMLFSVGGGFGAPSSEVSLVGGIDMDTAYTSHFPVFFERGGPRAEWTQALVYARGAVYGFSGSVGLLVSSTKGLDNYGQFTGGAQLDYRPGAPDDVDSGDDAKVSTAVIVSFRQAEGFGLGLTYADLVRRLPDGRKEMNRAVAAVRTQIAPERLAPEVGVPTLGLDRLAGELDYYLDQYEAGREAASQAQALPASATKAIYELPVGMENIAAAGLRARIVPQISPDVKFRMIDAAWSTTGLDQEDLPFSGGARVTVFSRSGSYVPSVDLFAGIRISQVASSWTVSYSFNSPDTTTFFPVPNAHVIGFQYVLGAPESAPAIVPIASHAAK